MAAPAHTRLASIAAGGALLGAGAPALVAEAGAPAPVAAKATLVYVIRRTPDAWTMMDPAAVVRVPGGVVRRAYSVTVRRNLLNAGEPHPGYVRTLNEYDCGGARVRWRNFTIYNRFGVAVLTQDNANPVYTPARPGSEEEVSLQVVCDGAGGGSVVATPSLGLLVIGLMQAWDDAATSQPVAPGAATKPGENKPEAKRSDSKTSGAKTPEPKPAKAPARP